MYLQEKKSNSISCELSTAYNQFTLAFFVRQFVCVMSYLANNNPSFMLWDNLPEHIHPLICDPET